MISPIPLSIECRWRGVRTCPNAQSYCASSLLRISIRPVRLNRNNLLTDLLPPASSNDTSPKILIAMSWIGECISSHAKCRKLEVGFYPTRMLEMRVFDDSEDIRLVETSLNQCSAGYVALSHCWGPAKFQPPKTTTKNLKNRERRIAFDELPLTFQDAVKITNDLEEHYLWIDSLCIIQDDEEDWQREASSMAAIYQNSAVTLAALSSRDGRAGCRTYPAQVGAKTRSGYAELEFGPERIRVLERRPKIWIERYGDLLDLWRNDGTMPLRTRAWTLQERALSTRSIHFAENCLLWECKTRRATSELPWHESTHDDHFDPYPIRNHLDESIADPGPVSSRGRWYRLIEDYSSRFMTKESEKLPAFMGLASHFQKHFPGNDYLAGIWQDHLPTALLWRSNLSSSHLDEFTRILAAFQPRRPMHYVAPSWSWASLIGRVTFESQRLLNDGTSRTAQQEDPSDFDYPHLRLVAAETKPTTPDPYSTIFPGAFLLIQGQLASLSFNFRNMLDDSTSPEDRIWPLGQTDLLHADPQDDVSSSPTVNPVVGALFPDIIPELQWVTSIWCLGVRPEPWASETPIPPLLYGKPMSSQTDFRADFGDMVMGLGLLGVGDKTADGVRVVRRIWLTRWVKRSVFEGVGLSTIKPI